MAYLILPEMAQNRGWTFTLDFCTYLCAYCFAANIALLIIEKVGKKSDFLQNRNQNVISIIQQQKQEEGEEQYLLENREVIQKPNYEIIEEEKITQIDSKSSDEGDDVVNDQSVFEGLKVCFRNLPFVTVLVISFFFYGCFLSFSALSPVFVSHYFNLDANQSSFVVSFL